MEEPQADAESAVTDSQPSLPSNEREITAQFEHEVFQAMDQRFFQVTFGIFVLQVRGTRVYTGP